jgi:hypothetical protein
MPEIQVVESPDSLSTTLWKGAADRVFECAEQLDNILFVARDEGSLWGLRRHHRKPTYIGFYAITAERLAVLDGMTFRFAYLIEPSDDVLARVKSITTEQVTIARRTRKGVRNATSAP